MWVSWLGTAFQLSLDTKERLLVCGEGSQVAPKGSAFACVLTCKEVSPCIVVPKGPACRKTGGRCSLK